MELLVEQLARRVAELGRWMQAEQGPPAEVRLIRSTGAEARLPEFDDSRAPLLLPNGDWREPLNSTIWLRFRLRRPDAWPAGDTALVAQRFGSYPLEVEARIGLNLQRMQGMLYVNGKPYHGLDQYHRLIYLPPGPDYQFAASVWTGLAETDWQPTPVFRLVRTDPAVTSLYHDLRVLSDALRSLPSTHAARPDLERIAESALLALDWTHAGTQAFSQSAARAHDLVTRELASLHAAAYEPRITAVGHAHIDCAWLWPISQTREKAGRTWSTALRLMERYPEYRFLASSPLQYEMVKQDFPETFAGIRQRIHEGRWEAVGGMWVEADCNLPDGESLARQILLGTRYFEHEFGVTSSVMWLPDTFGFPWVLPTLMRSAGLTYFVTHKLSWSQTNRIPHDTFRWRGPEGSEVLVHFLCAPSEWPSEQTTYNAVLLPRTVRGAWARFQDHDLHKDLLVAFGFGDGGGGPTIDMLEAGRRLADLPGFPTVQMGRADAFFRDIEAHLAGRAELPVWDGELYLEYHRGTYTGQARQKLRNALSQRLYHAAELFAVTARVLLGRAVPREQLHEGWKLILTNQFHDILPGSAISSVYVDAEADFQRLSTLGQAVLDAATTELATSLDLPAEALVVFNPSPFPSAEYLEVPADLRPDGLPGQLTATGGAVVYCEGVPPNGFQAFALKTATSTSSEEALHLSPTSIETPLYSIELDQAGRIRRLWAKRLQREIIPPGAVGNRLVVFEDKPLNYDAWDIDAYHAAKSREIDQLEGVAVREAGPERGVLEFRWRISDQTRIVQRMVVYARVPRIDFVTEVDWHERQTLLKAGFRTGVRNRRASYEIQFGTIDRPTHRNTSWEAAAFEIPAQRFVDLSEAHYGVALLADCKHGYSVSAETLWLTLLKGAIDPDPHADRGAHRFTYSLLPHAAGLDEVRRAAYSLSRPLLWRYEGAHPGRLPSPWSMARVDAPGVIIETLKWAEDEDALIVRAYEADGGAITARLQLGVPITSIAEVDLLERNPRPLRPHADGSVDVQFRAREVKTIRVRVETAKSLGRE